MANTGHCRGQTALVTGASGGIGLDLAECFARDGYDLILTARSEPALQEASRRLAATYGVTATSVAADLGVPGAGRELGDTWKEAEGTGVHVSCLCPGPTQSRFRERAGTGATRLSRAGTPMPSMRVAQLGYRGFRDSRRVMITGTRNAVLARLVPFLPRRAILGLVHNLQSPA